MVAELALLQEAGIAPLSHILTRTATLPSLLLLADGEEELYTATYQCVQSTHRLRELREEVGECIGNMGMEGVHDALYAAQKAVRARHMSGGERA